VPFTAVFSSFAEVTLERGEQREQVARLDARHQHQLALGRGGLDDLVDAAGLARQRGRDVEQAEDDDRGLEQVGEGDREHAAEQQVDEHHRRAEHDPLLERDAAPGEHVEADAQRQQVRRRPAEVGQRDRRPGADLHRPVVALAVEVADGEQVQPVEAAGEHQRDDDEAGGRAERVGDHARQSVLQEGGGHREHRLGAEPGREHGREVHVQRQASAGGEVVLGAVHAPRGIPADRDGEQQVQGDGGDEHGGRSRRGRERTGTGDPGTATPPGHCDAIGCAARGQACPCRE
jgi:hypothetical protein